jgi:hypothetical protein
MKKAEIDWACNTRGRKDKCIQIFSWNCEGKRQLRRLKHIWKGNIKMNPKMQNKEGIIVKFHVAQDGDE